MRKRAEITTDHAKIRTWIEKRGGKPATVPGSAGSDAVGILRIDFPTYSGKNPLQIISWNDFFKKFEERRLAFRFQETKFDGELSRFWKFVKRDDLIVQTYVNRRRHSRVAIGIAGTVLLPSQPKAPLECKILDISVGGAFIHCTVPIQIGQEILIEIDFEKTTVLNARVIQDFIKAPNAPSSPQKSVVRWVRGSSVAGFGVEFTALSVEMQNFLAKFVDYFTEVKG